MRYRFGSFKIVAETREFLASGQPRAVEPQVFDLLLHLIQERHRLVPVDELVDVVWNGRIVSDSAISARISAARRVLGDDGRRQQWIRTVQRRGFRFVGSAETLRDGAPEATPQHHQRVAFCRSRDGTRPAYATSGDGYPLVKAGHWLTHLEKDWNSPLWRPFLDRLSESFRVVRYDQRGNGLSQWDVADFSLERFVEDLEAVVATSGLDRFALYGTSQGAPAAVAYAARHPDRVSRLILHGGYEKGRTVRASEEERLKGEALLTLIRHGWGMPDSAFIEAFATMFIPAGTQAQIGSLAELQRSTTSPQNAAALRSAIDRFDVSAMLAEVKVPTLVIHARNDAVQPLDQGYRLAAGITGAEFLLLDSRNHVILPQEPAWDVLFDALKRFLMPEPQS